MNPRPPRNHENGRPHVDARSGERLIFRAVHFSPLGRAKNELTPICPGTLARRGGLLALAAALLLAAGCDSKGGVSGRVTLNGAPVKGGLVTFIGADKEQKVANISGDGEYRIDGVLPGTVKVTVTNLSTYVPVG